MDADIKLFSSITKKLLQCNYPFQWKPRDDLETFPEDMVSRTTQKIEEKAGESSDKFEIVMLHIILGYEHYINGNETDALKSFKTAETILTAAQADDCDDLHLKRLASPIFHIILSCKAHVLAYTDELQTAQAVSSSIPSFTASDVRNTAALIGLRAVFYSEYGIAGSLMGLKFATEANTKDPEESLWYFLRGKYMGRIRRVEKPFDIPPREEISALEKAVELEKDAASYTVFTAQLYRETANRVFRLHSKNRTVYASLKQQIDKLNEQSLKLYKKSVQLKPNCVHMMFRCAKGFIMLPDPYRDDVEAKRLLKKGLSIAQDSGYGNHVMAQYYERREKNRELAIVHLKICEKQKIFGACMDLLRLEYHIEKVDVVARLNKLREEFPENPRQCQLLSQLISYHIFILSDLQKACEYTKDCILLNPKCDDMFQHRPLAVITYDPIDHSVKRSSIKIINLCYFKAAPLAPNLRVFTKFPSCSQQHRPLAVITYDLIDLYAVIVDEIKIRLNDKTCPSTESLSYQKLLQDFREVGINVPTTPPKFLKTGIMEKFNSYRPAMFRKPGRQKPRLRMPRYTPQPQSVQPLSWRGLDEEKPSPKEFKTETIRNIDSVAEQWKARLAAENKQNELAYQKRENPDYETSDNDECNDTSLFKEIYKASSEVSRSRQRHNSNREANEDDHERVPSKKQERKYEKNKVSRSHSGAKPGSSRETNFDLNAGLQKISLDTQEEEEEGRASSLTQPKFRAPRSRADVKRGSSRGTDFDLAVSLKKILSDIESERPKSEEVEAYTRKNVADFQDDVDVLAYRKTKKERALLVRSEVSRKSHRSYSPDRHEIEERYSARSRNATGRGSKYEHSSDRSSNSDTDPRRGVELYERSGNRGRSDRESADDRRSTRSKYSDENKQMRKGDDCRHESSRRHSKDNDRRRHRKDNDRRHRKDKLKRWEESDSCSSDELEEINEKIKQFAATEFNPRTIRF